MVCIARCLIKKCIITSGFFSGVFKKPFCFSLSDTGRLLVFSQYWRVPITSYTLSLSGSRSLLKADLQTLSPPTLLSSKGETIRADSVVIETFHGEFFSCTPLLLPADLPVLVWWPLPPQAQDLQQRCSWECGGHHIKNETWPGGRTHRRQTRFSRFPDKEKKKNKTFRSTTSQNFFYKSIICKNQISANACHSTE